MSDPVLVNDYGNAFLYYTCDRDPTSSEPLTYNGYSNLLMYWWNTTSGDIFQCVNNTSSSMIWQKICSSSNILSLISNSGWNINTSRSYSLRSSPSFSTSYTPSITNDTTVIAVLSLTSTLLTSATVEFQVNSGSGYITIGESSISGLAATNIQTITCFVPANSEYQLINSSGTASIVSLNELIM